MWHHLVLSLVVVVVLLLLVHEVEGFSAGAPPSACSNQIPQHSDNPRSDTGGYATTPAGPYTCYKHGGKAVTIAITGSVTGFRGIMSSVHNGATVGTARRGTWTSYDSGIYHLQCNSGTTSAITHSDPNIKAGATWGWTPATAESCTEGTRTILTTVVRDFSTIYLLTASLAYDPYGGSGPGRLYPQGACPGLQMPGTGECQQCGVTLNGLPVYVSRNNGSCDTGSPVPLCNLGSAGYTIANNTVYACTQTVDAFVCNSHGILNYTISTGRYFNDTTGFCTCSSPYNGTRCDGTPCPSGSYQAPRVCTLCAAGTFSNSTGRTRCFACVDETVAPEAGSTSCAVCPGYQTFRTAAQACADCPLGMDYTTINGQAVCRCPAGGSARTPYVLGWQGASFTAGTMCLIDPHTGSVYQNVSRTSWTATGDIAGTALATDPDTNEVWGVTSGNSATTPRYLVKFVDLTTAQAAVIGPTHVTITGMGFRDSPSVLFGLATRAHMLYQVNRTSGAAINGVALELFTTFGGGLTFLPLSKTAVPSAAAQVMWIAANQALDAFNTTSGAYLPAYGEAILPRLDSGEVWSELTTSPQQTELLGSTIIGGYNPSRLIKYNPALQRISEVSVLHGQFSIDAITLVDFATVAGDNLLCPFKCTGDNWCRSSAPAAYCNASQICDVCPAGRFLNTSITGSSVSLCQACPAGQRSPANATSCGVCPAGTYTTSNSNSTCSLCPAGRYGYGTDATRCAQCSAGRASSIAGATSCSACAVNTYTDATGATSCTACASSSYSVTGASTCLSCPAGRISADFATAVTPFNWSDAATPFAVITGDAVYGGYYPQTISHVYGDVAAASIVDPVAVAGRLVSSGPDYANALSAASALEAELMALPATAIPLEIGGRTFGPGVYAASGDVQFTTGPVTIDGNWTTDPTVRYVFRAAPGHSVNAFHYLNFVNGSQPCQLAFVGASVFLGPASAGNVLGGIYGEQDVNFTGRVFVPDGNDVVMGISIFGFAACQQLTCNASVPVTPCAAGFFSATGDPPCSVCAAGRYSAAPRATACTDCGPAVWSVAGSASCSLAYTFRGYMGSVTALASGCPAGWSYLSIVYVLEYTTVSGDRWWVGPNNASAVSFGTNCYALRLLSIGSASCSGAVCTRSLLVRTECRHSIIDNTVFESCPCNPPLSKLFPIKVISSHCPESPGYTANQCERHGSRADQLNSVLTVTADSSGTTDAAIHDVVTGVLHSANDGIGAIDISTTTRDDQSTVRVVTTDGDLFLVATLGTPLLRAQNDLVIDYANINITHSDTVGGPLHDPTLHWTDISPAVYQPPKGLALTGSQTRLHACIGVLGCDGFAVNITRLLQLLPESQVYYVRMRVLVAPVALNVLPHSRRLLAVDPGSSVLSHFIEVRIHRVEVIDSIDSTTSSSTGSDLVVDTTIDVPPVDSRPHRHNSSSSSSDTTALVRAWMIGVGSAVAGFVLVLCVVLFGMRAYEERHLAQQRLAVNGEPLPLMPGPVQRRLARRFDDDGDDFL